MFLRGGHKRHKIGVQRGPIRYWVLVRCVRKLAHIVAFSTYGGTCTAGEVDALFDPLPPHSISPLSCAFAGLALSL
jgi:hypothetical protein